MRTDGRRLLPSALAFAVAFTLWLTISGTASARTPTPSGTWTNRYDVFSVEDPEKFPFVINGVLAQWHQAYAPVSYYVSTQQWNDFEDALDDWKTLNGGELAPLQFALLPPR